MKPASRIEATIEVLTRIEEHTRIPMDSVIGDYMRQRRYIGAKDRKEIAERVYEMTRAHARLGWWLEKVGAQDTPRERLIVWLALGEQIDAARAKTLFDGSKYAPEALSDKEAKRFGHLEGRSFDHPDMPEDVQLESPPFYAPSLKSYFGKNYAAEMAALLEPATLDLRTNIFVLSREEAVSSLKKDGVETTETPYSPWGLRCNERAYLAKTKALTKGHVSIQDEGSQLIAYLCDAQPGAQVLDYCAGAGGKTLALAAMMKRKGRIVAMDNDEKRLMKGKQRYKKSGLADIIEVRPLDDKGRKWLKRQKGKFDVVLTDVPCSGTGTWRRNPDMRWTNYGPELEELIGVQAEILNKASAMVKPGGGRLVYATCSLLPEENEQQIEAFLKTNPDFEVTPTPQELGTPYMRLTPHRHNTDGFFAAVLTRKADGISED